MMRCALDRVARASSVLALCCVSLGAQAALPDAVAAALKTAGIPASHVALWMAPASGGAPTLQHNITDAFNPASVMKLVTSSAALEVLGPSFTWSTDAFVQGELRDGVLNGNLVLRGGGDPALTWDRFGNFLRELRSRGLRDIRGDLVIDRSLFAPTGNEDFDDEPTRAYNAGPDALLVNFKAISIRLTPTAIGASLQAVNLVPMTLGIDNKLIATTGPCPNWRGSIRSEVVTLGDSQRLRLSGSMPASCGEKVLNLAMHDGLRLAGNIFRALWAEMGGSLNGTVREGNAPSDLAPFASWRSPALTEVLRDMNKYSNNVMARHVLLTLGTATMPTASPAIPRQPLTPAQGAQRVREWLSLRQIDQAGLVLENGSGLSRRERISAASLGNMLQMMWLSPRMPDLVASLPIAGEDGTARRRFGAQAVSGRAYLKTGSLNDVMSTAGFVQDVAGQWQVFVLMINDPRAEMAEAATIAAVGFAQQGEMRPVLAKGKADGKN
ncbi:D-alanyl-D-alanine carboxypeptidase/D-alanyl-D-alanine-endopeptidase [Uliginosibacterium sp. H3]|uniref:D-alanyl-D-alanine carboxypeptidase/D-alanyl-D-alanine-endopeptidase n=1 Tax=Uliginosibacterium silvisoli TaxID=3114758 RepID=A0ABU6K1U0_9RHOO|nr:D-alanyl-D-alanine carboxypeptidase/D-alanyl-D-alanine-endopeptidase [Uliginosibacterium sp. H3]